jgi:amylosucrase
LLLTLYGSHYDFYYHLENILSTAARMWLDRSGDLKALDKQREADPLWYQSEKMVGGVCYVDLFASDLRGLRSKIPYFKQLGLTYLHLMPLFRSPEGNSDGGYAVSSYRDVDPRLGTMSELSDLAADLRSNGISLVLDFVFNHTSDEHEWAIRAQQGDPTYADYYYIFPNRTMPDAYQRTLREIFPDQRPGSFTYRPDMDRWVWTTFNSFQWDLNYSNPAVFNSMAGEMLQLANRGAEILRLDALAFVWKEMGTDCENRPEAHLLIQAFNTIARIAAPALLFKSEAIVHPDRVIEYIGEHECQLSYNPLLMALLWETLATREVRLLALSMREKFEIGDCCAWVNYVRSHDDIGWTFDDNAAARLGIDGYGHRRFLNDFYTGRFKGSFARGLPFGENPRTGDVRISGTCASLVGLEQALHDTDTLSSASRSIEEAQTELNNAIGRILLLYGIVASIGGIPLIYLGDEVGTLNDYSYRDDPAKAADSRWVHRPRTDWERVASAAKGEGVEGRIYSGLLRLLDVRRATPALADGDMEVVDVANPHVFCFVRHHDAGRVLVLANFSEAEQSIPANEARLYGLGYTFRDLLSGDTLNLHDDIHLPPYCLMWLTPES